MVNLQEQITPKHISKKKKGYTLKYSLYIMIIVLVLYYKLIFYNILIYNRVYTVLI